MAYQYRAMGNNTRCKRECPAHSNQFRNSNTATSQKRDFYLRQCRDIEPGPPFLLFDPAGGRETLGQKALDCQPQSHGAQCYATPNDQILYTHPSPLQLSI